MDNRRRNPMLPRFLIASVVGIAVFICAGIFFFPGGADIHSKDAHAAAEAITASLGGNIMNTLNGPAQNDGSGASVTLIYSATPGGSVIERRVGVSADRINSAAPQDTDGYRFYWLLDGQIWDGTMAEGMTLRGTWVPIYEITVY